MAEALTPPYPVVIVLGPTAAGKSRFAMALADRFDSEIVSFDSIKVYRGMNIGTDKPSPEQIEKYGYHLVDIRAPSETMNAGEFVRLADEAVQDIARRGKLPIVEGGTALYLKSFLFGIFEGPERDEQFRKALYERGKRDGPETLHSELAEIDPARAQEILPADLKRIVRALEIAHTTGRKPSALRREWAREKPRREYNFVLFGVSRDRKELYARIDLRVDWMMEEGLLDEVAGIWQGDGFSRTSREAIGYRQLVAYLEGERELDEAVEDIKNSTHDFARRQENWFKRFPDVKWFHLEGDYLPVEEAARYLLDALPRLAGLQIN